MINRLIVALGLLSLSAHAQANCADLRGSYEGCRLVGTSSEEFNFELSQGFKAGEPIYRATGLRDGKQLTVPFLADAVSHPLRSDQNEILAPIPLDYIAVCDPTQVIVTVTSTALANAAAEKFYVSKDEDGNLRIVNQSLLLGKVIGTREITCKRSAAPIR
ncbi:MAG: hypothetical protein ABL958_03875 [Bdellovibrionia bacterium]